MSKKIFSAVVAVGMFAIANTASAATIYVDGAAAGANNGTSPTDAFTTIQAAINDGVTVDGDIISIADGTYVITSTIEVSKEVTLQGTSQAGTIIDGSSATGGFGKFGFHSSKSNITFSNFTLTGPTGSQGRGFKIEGTTTNVPSGTQNGVRSSNVTFSNVTVNGDGGVASRTGIDVNGVNTVSLTNVTSNDNGGNGISFTDCNDITLLNVSTSGNEWGGVALYTKGQFFPGGVSNVTITNLNSTEDNPLYNQNEGTFNAGGPFTTTGLNAPQFTYSGTNDLNAGTGEYVWYNDNSDEIGTWVLSQTGDTSHTKVIEVSSGNTVVVSSQTIQSRIDAATAGDVIMVPSGTFTEHLSITKALTLKGANAGTMGSSTSRVTETTIDGNGTDAAFYVAANDVTIDGFKIKGGAGGSYHSGVFLTTANTGNVVKNNIITDNSIGVYAECTDCTIERNLFDSNNRPGPAGGAGIYTENSTNLTIQNNEFKGHLINSAIVFAAGTGIGSHTGTTVSGNWIHDNNGDNSMIYVVGMTGGTFSGNTILQTGSNVLTFSNGNSNISVTGNNLFNSFRGVRIVDNGDLSGDGSYDSSNITLFHNQITGNSEAGAEVVSGFDGTLNAEMNWWGNANGPTSDQNPDGSGDKATGDIDAVPFCINPECTTPIVPETPSTPTTSGGGGFVIPAESYSTGGLQTGTVGGGTVLGASTFKFLKNLGFGSRGNDVIELHKILIAQGYLVLKTGLPTGWFGPMTKAALIKWQVANGIPATGVFGPLSRAKMNQ